MAPTSDEELKLRIFRWHGGIAEGNDRFPFLVLDTAATTQWQENRQRHVDE
ncbi:hypothetical protein SESBI_11914 [Sesbania bispinosa]|nr:hypothetical protein SESBI_11914 [Sesbania bispinosa]